MKPLISKYMRVKGAGGSVQHPMVCPGALLEPDISAGALMGPGSVV
ncbi:hypothetical protein FOXG_22902 [Fusarium oxysporum f. sp. lycopersici 4287]|uniref:Uncharacterized protein n=2 Tax=Fusarium oxysporum TaxID=5507 RepID=A0A0J9WDI9_FUSO4|nr:uncharacterized protein FOXG_22902 [Fusarium oxysporum f. sp. lycopersici 4287]EXK26636.1 hypothetical protein FOMG_16807 [Fusarium oxysporum f. sp. melonis 26406]KNB20700.1 hypothetical protein FOXG_22902 [Fusarium oxysporum f. sp. lycopersici 4287]